MTGRPTGGLHGLEAEMHFRAAQWFPIWFKKLIKQPQIYEHLLILSDSPA